MILKLLAPILVIFATTVIASDGIALYKSGNYKGAFKELTENPQKSANFYLGVMSFLGKGTERNPLMAIDYWEKGWINKDEKSGISLALHLISKKDPRGLSILTEVADAGSVNAQYELAKVYYSKKSSHHDFAKSFQWFSKASEQGKKEAQANLGLMYYYGEGTSKDMKLSEHWYTKSAEQGFVNSQYALGILLSPTDQKTAVYWLEKAADGGHVESALTLGDFFQQSKQDSETALYWFEIASNLGSEQATLPIAVLKYNSKDIDTHRDGFAMINRCNMKGDKQCLNVLLDIFMHKRFLANKDELKKYAN